VPKADDHGTVGLGAQRDPRRVGHFNDIGRLHDVDTCTLRRECHELAAKERGKFGLDDVRSSYEFNVVLKRKGCERVESARNGGPGSEIAPHGIHRDARQAYASCAVTRCSPA